MVLFIDSFLFNGEDFVKLRLEYLYNYVDYFYIVESIYTFSGIKKDAFYIDINKSWFLPYMDKIKFVYINDKLNNSDIKFQTENLKCFYEEKLQRNYIRNILLNTYTDDFILALCDVDEIYDYTTFESKEQLFSMLDTKTMLLRMKMYMYKFTNFLHDEWEMAFLISSTMLKQYEDLDYIRVYKLGSSTIRRVSGWHFNFFMKPEDIQRKLASFSHTDINRYPYNDVDYLSFVVSKDIDFQRRENFQYTILPFEDKFHNYPELFRKYVK